MASLDEVRKLAELARIRIPEDRLPKLAAEFESILAYVNQIEELSVSGSTKELPVVRNVFREDGEPHEKGAHTEKLAAQFPEREDNYLAVRQIISHD